MDYRGLSAGLRARVALEKHGFRPTHSLGQNFILDDKRIASLLDAAEVGETDNVLEVGPGPGVMTSALAARCRRVLAVEIDRSLEGVLEEVLAPHENADVVFQDVMKADLSALTAASFGAEPFRVVANLPYYITTDVILRLLSAGLPLTSVCAMVQKEAADRIMAHPGEKQWCATAANVQYFGVPEILLEVPPEVFEPAPHVMSCFMRIDVYPERPVKPNDEALFLRLITAAFAMRRKTLVNNLKSAFGLDAEAAKQVLSAASVDARVRGESLTLEELRRVADALAEAR